ncbi:MAG TPA: ABC transporter substrate-binding protein [Usitatibacter sp.]|jgi:branched-chain amino acid transport system substrate-binding protein|nr:ABC transporter substrate-binding protein [Usitatibacter sp.]
MKCIVAAAALLAAAFQAFAQAPAEPIRIGFLSVRTGALAAGGKQMEEGITLFLKERNNMLAGRKVELVIADTGGSPPQARAKTQELIERNHVNVIIGPLATFEALAIDDYIRQSQVPLITPTSAAQKDLAQQKQNDYVIHAVGTAAQPMHVLGDFAARKLGIKRVTIVADDFTYGHEGAAGFQHAFEDAGGRIVQKLWPPLNVGDYGSYVGQIRNDADGVYAGFAGINGLRFLKQYAEYGLKQAVFGNPTCVDEGVLKNMGDEALGVYSASWYSAQIDSPGNRKFVDAVMREYKVVPGFYTASTYVAAMVLESALDAIHGRFEDKPAFVRALHDARLAASPIGPIRIDEYGKPVLNIYVRKVERKDGRLVNSIVATYPAVSQFFNYDPKAFLAAPVYSREYPPLKP